MRGFCLEVAGDFACFTRPEMKVERVSYDVITPSAANAVFRAIFWKPAIRWKITKIEVLNPIRWFSIRRNEVSAIAGSKSRGIMIEDVRQQRAGLILRDVKYRLYAEFEYIPVDQRAKLMNPSPEYLLDGEENEICHQFEDRPDEKEAKYAAMFDNRVSRGRCFMQPYLGCREFSCSSFRLIRKPEKETQTPISETRDLGFMLYDMDYSDPKDIKPMFYRPQMENGVIIVPDVNSQEVYK
ncbi:MAG: type I-C CRISPR-associated protein Cas5 [Lentisphaerae bacterium]|nr:type I-C CRISPR-associated protein Cas5 [Lentisphaerota bacterium]